MSGDFEGLVELGAAAAVEAVALSGSTRTHCPNCGAKFDGPYCADCGQERDTHRRTIAKLLHDFFEDILSFDSRILRTVRALVLRPGELSCAFRDGRTQAYVPPIRLYFFVTLLFFVILSVSGIAILKLDIVAHKLTASEVASIKHKVVVAQQRVDAARKKVAATGADAGSSININIVGTKTPKVGDIFPTLRTHFFVPIDTSPKPITPKVQKGIDMMKSKFDAAQKEMAKEGKSGKVDSTGAWIMRRSLATMTALAHDPTAINGPLTNWIPRALFLLLPIFAGLTTLFHWRQRKDYFFVDHLVFSLNIHSFAFVVLIAAVWLAQVLSGGTVGWLALAAVGIYLLIAMKRFYGQSWTWTTIKFAFLSFVYTVFFLIPALAAVIAVSALEA
jgi:hypothetical protein